MPPSKIISFHIPIIYYHSVGPINPSWNRNFLTQELKYFRDQLEYFAKRYQVVSLKEYWEFKTGLRNPVNNPLIITFDDGFLDNWIWAFPLLKKYGFKATIFVSPEFVDRAGGIRPNLDDYEKGRAGMDEITRWGYLSWEEMKQMEVSGLVDIQAHTMTHTKYFISDRLVGFHHPGADILYPAGNLFPERKPYSIGNTGFEKLLPYGYPLFEESSSVVAKKVTINPQFFDECVTILKKYDFSNYTFTDALALIRPLHKSFRTANRLIADVETNEEYLQRIDYEIVGAKRIIEENIGKEVEFLCWPHGDNNSFLHQKALASGYKMTTKGKALIEADQEISRIPERMGMDYSSSLKKIKSFYKMKAFSGKFPYRLALEAFRRLH